MKESLIWILTLQDTSALPTGYRVDALCRLGLLVLQMSKHLWPLKIVLCEEVKIIITKLTSHFLQARLLRSQAVSG